MPESTRCRMISAPGDPPGSRVTMARNLAASRRSARVLIWVDFPDPSPPSKVMNCPRPEGLVTAALTVSLTVCLVVSLVVSLAICLAISEFLGAGAEHSDHEFAGAVDRPPHRR